MGRYEYEFFTDQMENEYFQMMNYGERVTIKTTFGVELSFVASNWDLVLDVPECYSGNLEGLCGDYDGDGPNDREQFGDNTENTED